MAKVLWIDDYAGRGGGGRMGFDALVWFVEKAGHSITIASTPQATEDALKQIDAYDLLILDIIMDPLEGSTSPEGRYGGIDVLQYLRQGELEIPVIILSVMTPQMIREEANRRSLDLSDLGVKEIRRKGSVTPTDLAAMVERYLPRNPKDSKKCQGRDSEN